MVGVQQFKSSVERGCRDLAPERMLAELLRDAR